MLFCYSLGRNTRTSGYPVSLIFSLPFIWKCLLLTWITRLQTLLSDGYEDGYGPWSVRSKPTKSPPRERAQSSSNHLCKYRTTSSHSSNTIIIWYSVFVDAGARTSFIRDSQTAQGVFESHINHLLRLSISWIITIVHICNANLNINCHLRQKPSQKRKRCLSYHRRSFTTD